MCLQNTIIGFEGKLLAKILLHALSAVFSDLCSAAYEGCSWESEASCFDDAINRVISENLFFGNF